MVTYCWEALVREYVADILMALDGWLRWVGKGRRRGVTPGADVISVA